MKQRTCILEEPGNDSNGAIRELWVTGGGRRIYEREENEENRKRDGGDTMSGKFGVLGWM